MRAAGRELNLTEWAVLAIVAEGTTHGFDVARELGAGSALGRIWTVRRPLVYRAVDTLLRYRLITEAGVEEGDRGPQRRLVRVTPTGRRAIGKWLDTPVEHVRDVRTELLLKLALLDRARRSPDALLRRQREVFGPTIEGLHEQLADADGFDQVLVQWRVESAEAVRRF